MRLLLKKAWNEKELLAQIDELQELIEPHRVDNNSWVKGKTEAFREIHSEPARGSDERIRRRQDARMDAGAATVDE